MIELSCFKCGKKLDSVFPEGSPTTQPYGGLMFRSNGNYGSTIFDPIQESVHLRIVACDECVVESGQVAEVQVKKGETIYEAVRLETGQKPS